ncbi:stimulator of interferon genes protein 3-like isoform X1 [Ptychodera flava]|uniref:stimulator of interferon genes protein 3-like isoform X1 n=1 Tax=Ptychodera flava TaxID=63121 RepID=UPI00396A4A55
MASEENNGFGPIPRRRGSAWVKGASIFFAMLFLAIAMLREFFDYPDRLEEWYGKQIWPSKNETVKMEQMFSTSLARFLVICSMAVITLILSEAIRRLCLLIEEVRHRHERYDGKLPKVITATFGVRHYQYLLILGLAVLVVVCGVPLAFADPLLSQYLVRYGDLTGILANIAVACLVNVFFSLKTPSEVEISELSEKDNLNVAHGLAWSYYFGYLKIILPELENTIENTTEWNDKMKEGDFLAKLFIVIPKACIIPENLGEDFEGVELQGKLQPLRKNRAGVTDRPYINSVYKITDPQTNEAHYCILEYATPVDSLYQMSYNPEAGLSAQDRHQQVQIFMRTLQQILDRNPECSKRCVLVPISGEDYERFPLAEVILKAIEQVKREEYIIEDGEDE